MTKIIAILTLTLSVWALPLQANPRIKDLASIEGVRTNQLVGYGLVVGLDGTGDQTTQTPFTVQSMRNMLTQLGVQLPPGVQLQLKNVAAVVVHAELAPFAKPGQTMDITVSSIGNAGSLRGGTLIMTPLKGVDGQIYAMAQGNLVVGGFGAEGRDGSSITVNVPSVGRIPSGAIVERSVPTLPFGGNQPLRLNLHTPDFSTASSLVESINALLGAGTAAATDPATIEVRAPANSSQRVAFMAQLENLPVEAGVPAARIVINSRTGTVVIGAGVRVLPSAVTHGSLSVTIREDPRVVQPREFGAGRTAIVEGSEVEIDQESSRMFLFSPGTELRELVDAVNQVGAAPGDLMAILEALKQAGALRADFVVI